MDFNSERIFIVTGASSGLGKATALMLIERGAKVVAIARNEQRLNQTKEECKYPENMFLEIKDLAKNIECLPQYVKSLKEKYGKFSGMAYCAGIVDMSPCKILEYDKMKQLFDINYYAPVFMIKGLTDKRNNIGEGTSIVVISSFSAHSLNKGLTSYAGSKAALTASIKVISKEVVRNGIRINVVSPSDVKTPMTQKELLNNRPDYESKYPFGFGNPDDVANVITFLLSDKAKWIAGQDYVIDCNSEQ